MNQHALIPRTPVLPAVRKGNSVPLPDYTLLEPDYDAVRAAWLRTLPSERSRASYRHNIDIFCAWANANGVSVWDVERAHARHYARLISELRASESTKATRLSVPSSFYRFAASEDLVPMNPFAHVRRPQPDKESKTQEMSALQVLAVLNTARDDKGEGARSYALCCLLFLTGLRISEACNLLVSEVDRHAGYPVITVTRKGGKRQMLTVNAETDEALRQAIALGSDDGRVVGWARHYSGVVVARVGKKARLPFHLHPHMGRHAFTTHALDNGASPRDVQAANGWSSPSMVSRYDRHAGSLDRSPVLTIGRVFGDYTSPHVTPSRAA